jgi:hypothetical protein
MSNVTIDLRIRGSMVWPKYFFQTIVIQYNNTNLHLHSPQLPGNEMSEYYRSEITVLCALPLIIKHYLYSTVNCTWDVMWTCLIVLDTFSFTIGYCKLIIIVLLCRNVFFFMLRCWWAIVCTCNPHINSLIKASLYIFPRQNVIK